MSTAVSTAPPVTFTEIANCLVDARWLIVNYGWRQNVLGDVKQGFSADGAILAASVRDTDRPAPGERQALHMAARLAFKRAVDNFEPGPWNDDAARTKAEVLDAFFNAEALARGVVS